jgi:hypothetical protein
LSKRSILFLLPGLGFLLLLVVMLGLLVLHMLGLMVQLAARLQKRSIVLLQPGLVFLLPLVLLLGLRVLQDVLSIMIQLGLMV